MDNSNSLSSSILQSSKVSLPTSAVGSTVGSTALSGDDSGFFESLTNINMTTWIIIILILAFLGFNIFVYLAKGTEDIASFFGPLTQKLFGTTTSVAGQTVDVAAEGAKAVVSGTAGAVNTGLTAVQDITPNNATSSIKSQPVQGQPTTRPSDSGLNKALNNSQEQNMDYQAVEASSSVHSGGGKSGWCFVGEDRGFRSCALVNEDDKCMSGDIFPSQELCINPNLRA
jgi:hypothetical protein